MSEIGRMDEIIEKFILNEELSKEEKKTRFEIAWDIWKSFNIIKSDLETEIMKSLYRRIKVSNEFKNYVILNEVDQSIIWAFKPEWAIESNKPILSYAISMTGIKFCSLVIGLRKYDQEVPFTGNLMEKKLPLNIKTSLDNLFDILLKKEGYSPKHVIWPHYYWIVANEFIFDFSFFAELAEKGIEGMTRKWFSEIVRLKNLTEKAIDEFITAYKAQI